MNKPAILLFVALSLHATSALAICKRHDNFMPGDHDQVIGGIIFADYREDKIEAYFYGEMCWTASEIAEEGNRRIFYKLIAGYDANGRIAGYIPLSSSATAIFTCPKGSILSSSNGYFDHLYNPGPGFHTWVCKSTEAAQPG
ncbi:hypothetical protein [Methylobacillus flagellatus]|nr:hypothetical protein [Methylobacillus flagellatus]